MSYRTPRLFLEDDQREKISLLIAHRLPWLIVGLLGGIAATVFSSYFETLLSQNIQLVYFIPVIVYMADAVGTQTETVYVRNLATEKVRFSTYIFKEFLLGLVLGSLLGSVIGAFTYLWIGKLETSITVAISMFATIATAPVIALIIPTVLQRERTDPALGAGPFTTVVQDFFSLIIYLAVASIVILN